MSQIDPQIRMLEKEGVEEGFRFLTRLTAEWHSGVNRFNAPGECLMTAFRNQKLPGIGGLSVNFYAGKNMARLRRIYVSASSRGHHVGRTLATTLVEHAALRFQNVCLFTDTADDDAFYLKCGLRRIDHEHATHLMCLSDS